MTVSGWFVRRTRAKSRANTGISRVCNTHHQLLDESNCRITKAHDRGISIRSRLPMRWSNNKIPDETWPRQSTLKWTTCTSGWYA